MGIESALLLPIRRQAVLHHLRRAGGSSLRIRGRLIEFIQDGANGILCEDGIVPFTEALRKLMESEVLRKQLGRGAKISVSEYTPERVWRKWENLLQHIAREKGMKF